jgi:hypothetical protein
MSAMESPLPRKLLVNPLARHNSRSGSCITILSEESTAMRPIVTPEAVTACPIPPPLLTPPHPALYHFSSLLFGADLGFHEEWLRDEP